MYVLCGNMMNDPQHCYLYSPLCYLDFFKKGVHGLRFSFQNVKVYSVYTRRGLLSVS